MALRAFDHVVAIDILVNRAGIYPPRTLPIDSAKIGEEALDHGGEGGYVSLLPRCQPFGQPLPGALRLLLELALSLHS